MNDDKEIIAIKETTAALKKLGYRGSLVAGSKWRLQKLTPDKAYGRFLYKLEGVKGHPLVDNLEDEESLYFSKDELVELYEVVSHMLRFEGKLKYTKSYSLPATSDGK